ncbi:MAG: hypothetical protein QOK15_2158 [Nocardioidaceae bacterium]|jgi:hypothetical protein|nr:hypothetical protein [Nocardioidaceae bacterium]
MTGRRAGVSAAVLTVLVVGLMLVLMMFAARTGPQRIVDGTLVDPHFGRVALQPIKPPAFESLRRHGQQGMFHQPAVLSWVGQIVRAGIFLLLGWLAYRGLRRLREVVRDRERPEPRPAEVQFDVLEDPGALIDEMQGDAAAQEALLSGGSARNAIVACWDRFEEQAARVGLARRPWETSSEFTLRLLDFVAADGGAVARLERLYHEARFSQHVIGEDRRTAAIEALESVHASLPARTSAVR